MTQPPHLTSLLPFLPFPIRRPHAIMRICLHFIVVIDIDGVYPKNYAIEVSFSRRESRSYVGMRPQSKKPPQFSVVESQPTYRMWSGSFCETQYTKKWVRHHIAYLCNIHGYMVSVTFCLCFILHYHSKSAFVTIQHYHRQYTTLSWNKASSTPHVLTPPYKRTTLLTLDWKSPWHHNTMRSKLHLPTQVIYPLRWYKISLCKYVSPTSVVCW